MSFSNNGYNSNKTYNSGNEVPKTVPTNIIGTKRKRQNNEIVLMDTIPITDTVFNALDPELQLFCSRFLLAEVPQGEHFYFISPKKLRNVLALLYLYSEVLGEGEEDAQDHVLNWVEYQNFEGAHRVVQGYTTKFRESGPTSLYLGELHEGLKLLYALLRDEELSNQVRADLLMYLNNSSHPRPVPRENQVQDPYARSIAEVVRTQGRPPLTNGGSAVNKSLAKKIRRYNNKISRLLSGL